MTKIVFKVFISLIFLCCFAHGSEFSKSFFSIKDIKQRKEEFIKVITPLIEKANEDIAKERKTIDLFFQKVESKGIKSVKAREKLAVEIIAKKYRIDSINKKELFKERVAPIPVSLAIAQAAVESGWGTSRFAKVANNIYGQWVWSDDDSVGIIPKQRQEGKKYRIRVFKTIQESVNSYMLNLNRHGAYKDFRTLRLEKGGSFNGIEAAETMTGYSGIGHEYVVLLKKVINSNKLLRFDSSYKNLSKQ